MASFIFYCHALSALAIRICSWNTCAFAFGQGIDDQVLWHFVEEAPTILFVVICVSSFLRFSKLSHQFGPVRSKRIFMLCDLHTIWLITNQHLLSRTSSARRTIACLTTGLPKWESYGFITFRH